MHEIKVVLNDKGMIFGSINGQHDRLGGGPVSYRQDGKGNALAGLFIGDRLEIRRDRRFSPERVRCLMDALGDLEPLARVAHYHVVYQGRDIGRIRQQASRRDDAPTDS